VTLDAVVLAAGEGRRLRPLTERWPKPILPVEGRPVVATLLRELAGAGFTVATVVVGHLAEQVRALVGDGSGFGLAVRYAWQPEPLGSADAVGRALAAGAHPPLLVTAADTVYQPGDLAAASERFAASGATGGLGVREVSEVGHQAAVGVQGGYVAEIADTPPPQAAGALTAAPLWFLSGELAASLGELEGPPFELSVAFQDAIDAGRRILALPLGPTRDLTRPEDVLERNFPYLWSRGMRDGHE